MNPEPGMLVTSNVRLVRPLGSGGMGSVWLARHLTLDTEVAVKFIAEQEREERLLERFRREASLAARLKSPHVVQMFDHGLAGDGDAPYIVMELLRGESLAQRLARTQRLTPREVVLLVSQVAKVLREAHALGIVHRDLKPTNLFLLDSGYELFVKVLDFGIAKHRASEPSTLTDSLTLVGTPQYMSPEALMSSRDVDHRADLWALSVVAYQCLTGEVPFRGETLSSLTIAIHEGFFAPPSSLERALTPDIDAWFKVALCRKIEQRPASASELAASFRRACAALVSLSGELDDEEPAAADPGTVTLDSDEKLDKSIAPPKRSRARRWPLPLAIGGLMAVGGVWLLNRPAEPATAISNATPHIEEPPVDKETPVVSSEPEPTPSARPVLVPRKAAPSASTTASAATPPSSCKEPFTVNEHGDLVPRPECFRR